MSRADTPSVRTPRKKIGTASQKKNWFDGFLEQIGASAAIPRSRRAIRARMEELRRRSGFQIDHGVQEQGVGVLRVRGGHSRGRRQRGQEIDGFNKSSITSPRQANASEP
jgi:hypothetical protein